MIAAVSEPSPADVQGPKPMLNGQRALAAHTSVYLFIGVPFIALIAAVPAAWGWGLGWLDIALAAGWYTVTCLGVTVGFHRYFTHGAFKAKRSMRIALAVVGS